MDLLQPSDSVSDRAGSLNINLMARLELTMPPWIVYVRVNSSTSVVAIAFQGFEDQDAANSAATLIKAVAPESTRVAVFPTATSVAPVA